MVLFFRFLPIVILPKAYTIEPYWATLSILFFPFILYKIVVGYSNSIAFLIRIYFVLFYAQWGSMFLTEIGECDLFLKPFKKYFTKTYSYLFEKKVVCSKYKYNCIYMLFYGNDLLIKYYQVYNTDFISILPITSWFIVGYNLVSVMNQSYMIFIKVFLIYKMLKFKFYFICMNK